MYNDNECMLSFFIHMVFMSSDLFQLNMYVSIVLVDWKCEPIVVRDL